MHSSELTYYKGDNKTAIDCHGDHEPEDGVDYDVGGESCSHPTGEMCEDT